MLFRLTCCPLCDACWLQVTKDRATTWSLECAKNWTVLAEQSSVFYDLLNTEPAIAKAFALKWFRSALISSEDTSSREPGGDSSSNGNGNGAGGEASSSSKPPRHQLRFVFALPPREQREEINQLMVRTSACLGTGCWACQGCSRRQVCSVLCQGSTARRGGKVVGCCQQCKIQAAVMPLLHVLLLTGIYCYCCSYGCLHWCPPRPPPTPIASFTLPSPCK